LLEVALQRLVTPAPHALRAVAGVPFFIDDPGDPDAEVEAQSEEPPLKQHVPAEQRAVPTVDAAQDPSVGELVPTDQVACGLPQPPALGLARSLLAEPRGAGIDVPVPLSRLDAVLRSVRLIVVDTQPGQLIERGRLVDLAKQPLAHLLGGLQ
jgi:hypothetical protein